MRTQKFSIKGSPFIGVFCRTTETITLVPHETSPTEKKKAENILGTELVPTSIANSSLLGVLAIGNRNGFVVPEIIENSELKELRQIGIRIQLVKGVEAIGNLVAVNDSCGVCSPMLQPSTIQQVENTLKIKLTKTRVANSELAGAASILNSRGFVCNANATKEEFLRLKKITGLKGNLTTANFGDPFIGNSVIANSNGILAGLNSTPHELIAIEEALSGEA